MNSKILIVYFLMAVGLASALPQLQVPNLNPSSVIKTDALEKELNDEVAKNQVLPVVLIPALVSIAATLGTKILKYAVCDNTDSQLHQEIANIEERDADVMALIEVMSDLLAADEKLDKVKQQINMQDDLTAKAEHFDWVDTVKTKLKSTLSKVGGAAKKLLCGS